MMKTAILAASVGAALARDGCTWNYADTRCEPVDSCEYAFQLQDVKPTDSCRPRAVKLSDMPKVTNDDDCSWDYGHAECTPTDGCSYQYHFGDLTLGQSCRMTANTTPEQAHIAYAGADANGNPTGMTVSWATSEDTDQSIVMYGTESGQLDSTATGSSSTYYETYSHHTVLEDLAPNTRYFYRAGDGTTWTQEFSFLSAPAEKTYPTSMAVIGDMGVYNAADTLARLEVVKDEVTWLHHVGDVSYADDAFLHNPLAFDYENTWNKYMGQMENITASLPWLVLPGNHEAECHSPACQISEEKASSLGNFSAYRNRFRMPYEESGASSDGMWYAYSVGPFRMVNIDTETDYPDSPNDHYKILGGGNGGFGDQLAWLKTELENSNTPEARAAHPWLIVSGHRPIYTIDQQKDGVPTGDCVNTQTAFEDMMYENNVDMYIAGHKHSEERQLPIYRNVPEEDYVEPRAPVHVINGAGGNTEDHSGYCDGTNKGAPWNVFSDCSHWGVSVITAYNDTALRYELRSSTDGTVLDAFDVSKTH